MDEGGWSMANGSWRGLPQHLIRAVGARRRGWGPAKIQKLPNEPKLLRRAILANMRSIRVLCRLGVGELYTFLGFVLENEPKFFSPAVCDVPVMQGIGSVLEARDWCNELVRQGLACVLEAREVLVLKTDGKKVGDSISVFAALQFAGSAVQYHA